MSKEHQEFRHALEGALWDSVKGCGPVDAALIKEMLKEHNLEPDFTAGELLKAWMG